MKNLKTVIRTLALSTVGFALSANAAFADTVCTPDLQATYESGHGTSIKIVAIEYRLNNATQWHREDVSNTVLNKGESKTFKSQRLGAVAKGSKLDLRAVFQPDTGRGYGSEERGDVRDSGKVCENNVKYLVVVK